jgi:fatty acid desaturase
MSEAPFAHVDRAAFARDLDALRAEVDASTHAADLAHLLRMERWGRACAAVGYATAWVGPNPLSMVALSTASVARWAIVAHHVVHRGYDKVEGAPARLTSAGFGVGRRRLVDWFDWMLPEAWRLEHNTLHHYHTGETLDPDLVEENVRAVRDAKLPRAVKYAVVGFYAMTWKFTYYAPNTWQVMRRAERCREAGQAPAPKKIASGPESYLGVYNPFSADGRRYLRECALPYGLARFVVIPAAFSPLGPWAVASVWVNSVGAELLNNLHSFAIIAPNHAGDDVWRFEGPARERGEFYLRQVVGSVNYLTGHPLGDFLQGYLNYQIEHHLWPDLPADAYRRLQPKVKAVCERHGVPYVQEPLHRRVKKLVDIMVGATSMRRAPAAATRDEPRGDAAPATG